MANGGLGLNPQTMLLGLSGLAGGLANRAQTTRGTTTSRGTSTSTGRSSNRIDDPNLLAMRNRAFQEYENLLNPASLEGFTANRLSTINRTSDIQRQNLEGELAARGITGPAAAAAIQNLESQRFSGVTQARNEQPLLERQLREQALSNFGGFISSAPVAGQTQETMQTGMQTQTGTSATTEPGDVAGGALTSLGTTLAGLMGEGFFGLGGGGGGAIGTLNPGTGALVSGAGVGGKIGGALGGAGKAIVGLFTNPVTGIPLALGLGGLAAYKSIGRGRKQANKLTDEGGLQNTFDTEILPSIVDNPNLTQEQKNMMIQQAFQELQQESSGFAAKGKNQKKVVEQMLASYRTNPVTASALASLGA